MAFINNNDNSWLDSLLVSRNSQPEDTVVDLGDGICIGDGSFQVIAGPCTVESRKQVLETAMAVQKAGAKVFRGGAYKSRTSPYDFEGMRTEGLELLKEVRRAIGMPIVTEIVNASHLPLFEDVDVIQVGERNMRNAELLRELGQTDKPILLKRSHSATLKELLLAAEYILAGGNSNVILCERGIRTFEPMTRNTLDLSAVPLLKQMTHLPVIVDPSHATGLPQIIRPMAMAATAAGCDGLMVEVHINPDDALCDGSQSLAPEDFEDLMESVNAILPVAYRW